MHCQGPGSCLPSFQWHGLLSFGAWLPPPNSPLWSSLVLTTAIIVFLAVLCERRTFGEPPHGCWEHSPSLLPWVMCTRLPAGRQPGPELLARVQTSCALLEKASPSPGEAPVCNLLAAGTGFCHSPLVPAGYHFPSHCMTTLVEQWPCHVSSVSRITRDVHLA